jgi:methionyl-tRNA synthetase
MEITAFDIDQFEPAYDVRVRKVLAGRSGDRVPYSAYWAIVAPGQRTRPHRHDECESFFIAEGIGEVTCDGVSNRVEPRSVIHFAPFERHTLENIGKTDLIFLTVAWRDSARSVLATPSQQQARPIGFVVSAPPTPNGDLHLGHLSGPYIAADIYRRYLRLRGVNALHVTGTDDFQSYVVAKGAAIQLPAEQTADRFASEIQHTLGALKIDVDHFTRPLHSASYGEAVTRLFRRLVDDGAIYRAEQPALVDPDDGSYLYEFLVRGRCPFCNTPTAGNICEECGHPNMCVDLIDAAVARTGKTPRLRPIARLHFRLSRYADWLEEFHDRNSTPPRLRALLSQLKARGLPDVAVTHPGAWGLPVPVAGFADQRMWAWLEMALGYVATLGGLSDQRDEAAFLGGLRTTFFFGYDNAFYYAILFPAVYRALFPDRDITMDFVCNEFLLLDGAKFSTSRGHAIWGRDFVRENSPEAVRFSLCHVRPEVQRTDFTRERHDALVEAELVESWQGWLLGLGSRLRDAWAGVVPDTGTWTLQHRAFYRRLHDIARLAAELYAPPSFSPRGVARLLSGLVHEAAQFSEAERHWGGSAPPTAEARSVVVLEIAAARLLALLSAPMMPDFAAWLWRSLGDSQSIEAFRWPEVPPLPAAGSAVCLDEPFFQQSRAQLR